MGTNKTTKETRRASYDAVIPKVKERSRLILETLGSRSMTVSEITDELVKAGRIPYYNRNYVAPRLSELKDMGVVETCGRRRSTHSTASAAIVGAVMVALIVFGLRCIFGPCFDEYGEIHECPGCQGAKENACPGCRYNPAYWDHAKYIGPSRWRLRKLRKEARHDSP